MKKLLFSAVACLAIATSAFAANAENQIEEDNSLKEIVNQNDFFAPCSGYIIVKNKKGAVIFSESYASNGPTKADCSSGFLNELQLVINKYGTNVSYESDVNWN